MEMMYADGRDDMSFSDTIDRLFDQWWALLDQGKTIGVIRVSKYLFNGF